MSLYYRLLLGFATASKAVGCIDLLGILAQLSVVIGTHITQKGLNHMNPVNKTASIPNLPTSQEELQVGCVVENKLSSNETFTAPLPKTLHDRDIGTLSSFPIIDWHVQFNESSFLETERLFLQEMTFSEEEVSLVRLLNAERRSGKAHWTVLNMDKGFSTSDLQSVYGCHHIENGFYGRIWVLREKLTNTPIGLFQTTSPNEDGFCSIRRHILSEYCGKGLGSEAIEGVFKFYKSTDSSIFKQYSTSQVKVYSILCLLDLAKQYMDSEKFTIFHAKIKSMSNRQIYEKRFDLLKYFSCDKYNVVITYFFNLKELPENERTRFRGLASVPVSEASKRSIAKCGFVQKSGTTQFIKM